MARAPWSDEGPLELNQWSFHIVFLDGDVASVDYDQVDKAGAYTGIERGRAIVTFYNLGILGAVIFKEQPCVFSR